MATLPGEMDDPLDLREQIARIDQMRANSDKLYAETQKMLAEAQKSDLDIRLSPWMLLAQGLIAGAAILGAGAALAKLFLT